ncbi:MAG: hypothetical protein RML35_03380 [Chloroherpetonaceae bacterium]|nr:hypothetical protein [Chloroherpetonaceae bacterium]
MAQFEGKTIYIFSEYLFEEAARLIQAYIGEYKVKQVVLFTKSTYIAEQFRLRFAEWAKSGRLHARAIGMQLEDAIDAAVADFGRPDAVISMPFEPIPIKPLVADKSGNWENVFNEEDFRGAGGEQPYFPLPYCTKVFTSGSATNCARYAQNFAALHCRRVCACQFHQDNAPQSYRDIRR